ncbi:MAG TPA: alpha/beta-hydrolase family protein [Candidatus Lustribacter sp.]|nr:alpha/beta-hydrolase family protein [Candidatus Lustribacter sp.]
MDVSRVALVGRHPWWERQVGRGTPDSGRTALVDRVVGWRRDRIAGVSGTGALVAVVAYVGSNTPSLLPRPWLLQGLVAALCAALGYVIGVGVGWLAHAFVEWADLRLTVRPSARRLMLTIWIALLGLGLLVAPLASLDWHRRIAEAVGFEAPGVGYVAASTAASVAGFLGLIGVWRLVAGLVDWVTVRVHRRILRETLARAVASLVTLVLVLLVVDQVLVRGFLVVARRSAEQVNATQPRDFAAPTSSLRSGGPGSTEPWTSLGQDGAIFVSSGPSQSDIVAATGRPAREPIRVYAGVGDGRSMEQTRDAAVAELERTGAFDRAAILVVTSTSTGFINEWSAAAFEYLGGGDTAVVSLQYSTLPSAVAFLTAAQDPPQAGRLLLDGVAARVTQRPVGRRPKVYAAGESLGAYGGNGAFASPEDMLARVDGALWTGTPSFTDNARALASSRALGSTVVDPVVDNGAHVRFAGSPAELTADQFGRDLGSWRYPRVAYLQHPSDPVVWWSTDLIFATPPWLDVTRTASSPMAQMSWMPLVTFWQVTADLAMANSVPGGFGHRYFADETVPAWAGILGLDPQADYSQIVSRINDATKTAEAGQLG